MPLTDSTVAIGVVAYEAPELVTSTLNSLRDCTSVPHELWLLGDGADRETMGLLESWPDAHRSCTLEARGMAACFNRLAAASTAGVLVLLEEGCIVTPGWLQRLLNALEQEGIGLAGPSTNLCWNEQQIRVPPNSDIRERTRLAAQKYGNVARQLKPLYSLADFCYAVRREVVDAIGPADEAYGLGPCWEMDYNVRAERGGWHGVWVCGAYVHRSVLTSRRQKSETEQLEQNKRRYQSKFCARQLRTLRAPFRSHCRGDDCPNFARNLAAPNPQRSSDKLVPLIELRQKRDLVTCIMPTRNRRQWVERSINCFLAQDYDERELLILDDGEDSIADLVPTDSRIRYKRTEGHLVIGAKRNLACSLARGTLIAHWDDDDWYPSWRLTRQVEALLQHNAELCGSSELYYIDHAARKAFRYAYSDKRAWVAGNTLLYHRSFWQKHRFPEIQIGEDTRFVWMTTAGQIVDLKDPTICVASIHAANASRKIVAGHWWNPVSFVEVLAMVDQSPPATGASEPLVSCIMPTQDRRQFLKLSLQSFAEQDYPNRELIIVDDGRDGVEDLVKETSVIRYVYLKKRTSIGEKRNIACSMARGQIIAHWDDDDWYAPSRIRAQATPLLRGTAELTGLHNSHILCLPQGEFWGPSDKLHRAMFVGNVHGGTLVYWKRIWEQGIRYPHINLAEDAMLIRNSLAKGNRLQAIDNAGVFVYVRHGRNAWAFEPGRFLDPAGWKRTLAPQTFPPGLLQDYRGAALACR